MARIIDRSLQSQKQNTGLGIVNSCGLCSFIMIMLLLIGGIFTFFQYQNYNSYSSSKTKNTESVEFEVRSGETVASITKRLVENGIIEDKNFFIIPTSELFVRLNTINSDKIQAGLHQIPPQTPILEVYNYFQLKECEQVKVTFKEGMRVEEFAETMDKALAGKDGAVFDQAEFVNIARNYDGQINGIGFQAPKNLEGYLFPDTYNFCVDVTTRQAVDRLLKTFNDKVYNEVASDLINKNLNLNEVVNKASMVEREAFNNDERKVIAGIIENRLNRGEVLGIDATSQYSLGYVQSQNTWWAKDFAIVQQLQKDEPYNTRKRAGIPPTPISSPSLNSVKAVINPTKTDYIFYLHDDCGGIHYGRTLNEHEINKARYIGTGRCN